MDYLERGNGERIVVFDAIYMAALKVPTVSAYRGIAVFWDQSCDYGYDVAVLDIIDQMPEQDRRYLVAIVARNQGVELYWRTLIPSAYAEGSEIAIISLTAHPTAHTQASDEVASPGSGATARCNSWSVDVSRLCGSEPLNPDTVNPARMPRA